jgi:hypothetical protein
MQKNKYTLKFLVTTNGFKNNEARAKHIYDMIEESLDKKWFVYRGNVIKEILEPAHTNVTNDIIVALKKFTYCDDEYICETNIILDKEHPLLVAVIAYLTKKITTNYSAAKFTLQVLVSAYTSYTFNPNNNNNNATQEKAKTEGSTHYMHVTDDTYGYVRLGPCQSGVLPALAENAKVALEAPTETGTGNSKAGDIRHMMLMVQCVRFQRGLMPLPINTKLVDLIREFDQNYHDFPNVTNHLLLMGFQYRKKYYESMLSDLQERVNELAKRAENENEKK